MNTAHLGCYMQMHPLVYERGPYFEHSTKIPYNKEFLMKQNMKSELKDSSHEKEKLSNTGKEK